VHTEQYDHACPQTDRRNRFGPRPARRDHWLIPHSDRGTADQKLSRFRALALFGRRPSKRVDSLVMPASENLHNSRHVSFDERGF
jgi:hypothetical protein